jgi:hypothetical protein
VVKQLEAVGVKQGVLNITSCSSEINQCHKGASETTIDYGIMHYLK